MQALNHRLIRDWEDFEPGTVDYTLPLFCDTETEAVLGVSDTSKATKGLYGGVRLVQMFQEHWQDALLMDVRFLDLQPVLNVIQPASTVWHNGAYDLHTINCATDELWLPKGVDDTIYLSRIALFNKGAKFDYYSCLRYIRYKDERINTFDKAAWQKYDWSGMLSDDALDYAALDVLAMPALYNIVKGVDESESYQLDLVNLLYAIEYSRRGVPINKETVIKEMLHHTTEADRLLEILYPLNPNSSPQCCEFLGTKSSDADTLLIETHNGNPKAKLIGEARHHLKSASYLLSHNTSVIKGFFNPSAAVTGRWSCSGGGRITHDNRQQHPRHLLHIQEAPEGKVFVYKDYAGLELRLTVAWTGEPIMLAMMRDGEDIHTFTTLSIMHIVLADMTKEHRTTGKQFTFASLYGAREAMIQKILRGLGIFLTIKEIRAMRSAYFATYEYFDAWHKMHKHQFDTQGYIDVVTALGKPIRATALTDSLAFPIQGSAAEVTKVSLAILKSRYPTENLVTTIHDANALLVDEAKADIWVDRLNECMVEAWYYVIKDLAVPDLPMPAEAEYNTVWKFD